MQPVVCISHWTQHIFRHLVAGKLNECGILSTPVASQQTNHDSTNGWVKSHWKPKRLYETALYHCPPALAAALCGRPASSSDVTSSLHSVCIPMASSFFGCHTTLVLCLAGTLHYGYFFSPPVCCLRVRGAINKHCAFMVCSCVAHQGITHAAMALHAYVDKLLTEYTNLHVFVYLFNYTNGFL